MSLTSPRLIVPLLVLALTALTVVSCSQQDSPTSPSLSLAPGASALKSAPTQTFALPPVVVERYVTLFDDAPPAEGPVPGEPPPAGDPVPVPDPVPAPPPVSGSAPSPWPPGAPPRAEAGVPVPTPPSTHLRVLIKVDPEPVAHSGTPVGIFACRDSKYTWYYDQIIHAETGIAVTFTTRENFFDGRFVSKSTEPISLPPNGTVILHTRWCSGHPIPHYTQSRYSGRDEYNEPVTISGPWVRLLMP